MSYMWLILEFICPQYSTFISSNSRVYWWLETVIRASRTISAIIWYNYCDSQYLFLRKAVHSSKSIEYKILAVQYTLIHSYLYHRFGPDRHEHSSPQFERLVFQNGESLFLKDQSTKINGEQLYYSYDDVRNYIWELIYCPKFMSYQVRIRQLIWLLAGVYQI